MDCASGMSTVEAVIHEPAHDKDRVGVQQDSEVTSQAHANGHSRRLSDAASDLSSAFSSSSSSDGNNDRDAVGKYAELADLPSIDVLLTILQEFGPAAFLRKYLHVERYSAAEMLAALDVPISADLLETGKPDFLTLLHGYVHSLYYKDKERPDSVFETVELLKTARKILVITGAGISTSLGIPDFRSANGIYSQMDKYNLFDPQEMFDIELFHHDPSIFYDFCKHLIPASHARYSPTHAFIRLLQDQGRLLRLYTQNIDNIEAHAGVHEHKLVQCHGSFRTFTCVTCGEQVPGHTLFDVIRRTTIPKCSTCWPAILEPSKHLKTRKRAWQDDKQDSDDEHAADDRGASFGVMKPDMTFFGEQLPTRFADLIRGDRQETDLVICIGTSLKVAPVAAIPRVVKATVPQVFISREAATRDYIFNVELLGACDDVVQDLARAADWEQALASIIESGK